jgi:hypothetical protein
MLAAVRGHAPLVLDRIRKRRELFRRRLEFFRKLVRYHLLLRVGNPP